MDDIAPNFHPTFQCSEPPPFRLRLDRGRSQTSLQVSDRLIQHPAGTRGNHTTRSFRHLTGAFLRLAARFVLIRSNRFQPSTLNPQLSFARVGRR